MNEFNPEEQKEFLSQLVSAVRELAEEHPYARYRSPDEKHGGCYYFSGRAGEGRGCIVGQAIQSLPPSPIADYVRDRAQEWDRKGPISIQLLIDFVPVDTPEISWLRVAQLQQDDNEPWGRCVCAADEYVPLDSQ